MSLINVSYHFWLDLLNTFYSYYQVDNSDKSLKTKQIIATFFH